MFPIIKRVSTREVRQRFTPITSDLFYPLGFLLVHLLPGMNHVNRIASITIRILSRIEYFGFVFSDASWIFFRKSSIIPFDTS
jgi:hypothetical protein